MLEQRSLSQPEVPVECRAFGLRGSIHRGRVGRSMPEEKAGAGSRTHQDTLRFPFAAQDSFQLDLGSKHFDLFKGPNSGSRSAWQPAGQEASKGLTRVPRSAKLNRLLNNVGLPGSRWRSHRDIFGHPLSSPPPVSEAKSQTSMFLRSFIACSFCRHMRSSSASAEHRVGQ